MNQEKSLTEIKEAMKEVSYFIATSKESNGYECLNMRVVTHLENLRDKINSALTELNNELLIHR